MEIVAFRKHIRNTGFSSEIGTKLRESAVGQAGGSCYSRAALSSNDSKMLYIESTDYGLTLIHDCDDGEPEVYEPRHCRGLLLPMEPNFR